MAFDVTEKKNVFRLFCQENEKVLEPSASPSRHGEDCCSRLSGSPLFGLNLADSPQPARLSRPTRRQALSASLGILWLPPAIPAILTRIVSSVPSQAQTKSRGAGSRCAWLILPPRRSKLGW